MVSVSLWRDASFQQLVFSMPGRTYVGFCDVLGCLGGDIGMKNATKCNKQSLNFNASRAAPRPGPHFHEEFQKLAAKHQQLNGVP